MKIETVLDNRRWKYARFPFPHVAAEDVFVSSVYSQLAASFSAQLAPGSSDVGTQRSFRKSIPSYDALISRIPPNDTEPLTIFLSSEWRDLLGGLFPIKITADVNAELHHHPIGSRSGNIHNDLNPGWFTGTASASEVNISDKSLCSYKHGKCLDPSAKPRRTVRAIAMIYYLNNDQWRPGYGGETGLYTAISDPVDNPAVAVAPINNSMVVFECTPFSFHSFISNKRIDRNAIVLWLHRPDVDAIKLWGEDAIIKWPTRTRM